jgi:hypothetical protein
MDSLLGFTGDLVIGTQKDARSLSHLLEQIPATWHLIVNFEGTLHDDSQALTPSRPKLLITSPLQLFQKLDKRALLAACTANNHIGDFGNSTARFTNSELSKCFPTFGSGLEADQFHLLTCHHNGVRIGLASYCGAEVDDSMKFCSKSFVGPRLLTREQAVADAEHLSKTSEHSIALVHWGDEFFHYPKPEQVLFGRFLVDAGFRIVVGGHAHAVQGYERYKGGYIFYGLGNFFFPDYATTVCGQRFTLNWPARSRWSIVPLFQVTHTEMLLHAIECVVIRGGLPQVSANRRFLRRLRRLSNPLNSAHYARSIEMRRAIEKVRIRCARFAVRDDKWQVIRRKLTGGLFS